MKLLLDQGVPAPLRHVFVGHEVTTARQMGWDTLQNGELLRAAESLFDALATADQNLKYQQNLSDRRLAILVLPTTSWPRLGQHAAFIAKAVEDLKSGDFVEQLPA